MNRVIIPALRVMASNAVMSGFKPKHAYLGWIEYKQFMEELREYQMYMSHDTIQYGEINFEGLVIHEVKEESHMGVGN